MKCPHCNKRIDDAMIVQSAASINGKKGNKGGARPGAGRPKKAKKGPGNVG